MSSGANGTRSDVAAATFPVAVAQMNSRDDKTINVATALALIDRAAAGGARLVALPEVWIYLGPPEGNRPNAEPIPGPTIARLAERARRHRIYIHAGSIQELSEDGSRLYNTAVVLDPEGEIVATYRKLHMFDVVLDGVAAYQESATITPGDEIVVVSVDGVRVGLATCYDLRFPELFRILALRGAEVIVVPAAFTMTTGKDHWEILIRARAIENGLFLVAAAQVGQHPPGGWCYGRSMIVDPWGTVLATAPDEETVIRADLDLSRVQKIRRQIPSLANRRADAYHWPEPANLGMAQPQPALAAR
jgi:predicted amidohydrolase